MGSPERAREASIRSSARKSGCRISWAARRGVTWPSTGRRTRAKAGERRTGRGTGGEEEERGGHGGAAGKDAEGCVRGAGVFEEWHKRVISLVRMGISTLNPIY